MRKIAWAVHNFLLLSICVMVVYPFVHSYGFCKGLGFGFAVLAGCFITIYGLLWSMAVLNRRE